MNIKNKKFLLSSSLLLPFSSLLANGDSSSSSSGPTSGIGKAVKEILTEDTTKNMIRTGAAIGGIYGGYKVFISGESNTLNYILLLGGTALVSAYDNIINIIIGALP